MRTLGKGAPRFDDLDVTATTKPLETLSRAMAQLPARVAYKGFMKLAAARGHENDSDFVWDMMRVRYEHLRSIASK